MSDKEAQLLGDFRQKINEIDQSIVNLILERIQYARKIGEAKRQSATPVYRPDREKEVYSNILKYVRKSPLAGSLSDEIIINIYREIMSGAIAAENGPTVAYMGPPSSFTHLACHRRFGSSVEAIPVASIPEVFRVVEAGREARYGVVPVENSSEGSVGPTLDLLLNSDVKIYAEVYVRAEQNLMHSKKVKLSSIKKLYSNKIAQESCRNWLQKNLHMNRVEIVETISTAAAAQMASQRQDGAALASRLAADTYNLKLLAENVHDNAKNITRFLIIGYDETPPSGDDKTSIICAVKDKPGSLYQILRHFHEAKINLTRIESRSARRNYGDYNFFIDFDGHQEDASVKNILKKLVHNTSFLKILGSYPRVELP